MTRGHLGAAAALRRGRRRGQSLAEIAIAIPFLMFLLMGGFDASLMIANKLEAGYAVRQGARLAAELGGTQANPGARTIDIDNQIIRNVMAVAQGMTAATIKEIDIYAPRQVDGAYSPGDLLDQYFISPGGGITTGIQTFPVSQRAQTPPGETSIGIRLIWAYSPPAGVLPRNMQLADYAVMKAAPILI
jgi:hypothetical protein